MGVEGQRGSVSRCLVRCTARLRSPQPSLCSSHLTPARRAPTPNPHPHPQPPAALVRRVQHERRPQRHREAARRRRDLGILAHPQQQRRAARPQQEGAHAVGEGDGQRALQHDADLCVALVRWAVACALGASAVSHLISHPAGWSSFRHRRRTAGVLRANRRAPRSRIPQTTTATLLPHHLVALGSVRLPTKRLHCGHHTQHPASHQ